MAYRETEKVRSRKAQTFDKILVTALYVVAEHGFNSVQMAELAKRAGVATGTLYRYFPSKEALCTEVFQRATDVEVSKVQQALAETSGNGAKRIAAALRIFAERALRAPTMAWALIAEPVDPTVDQARLDYRQRYARLFELAIHDGIRDGSLPEQNAQLSSTALVGCIAESLVGPLAPARTQEANSPASASSATLIIAPIVAFCLQGLTGRPYEEQHHD